MIWRNHFQLLADQSNLDRLKRILDAQTNINAMDSMNETVLHYACCKGNLEIVQWIMEKNADLEVKNCTGWTPLYCASYFNHVEVAQYLIDRGADVNAQDSYGCTILHRSTNYAIIELFLNKGAKKEMRDIYGCTPLLRALQGHGKGDAVHLLLQRGADIYAPDESGQTPFLAAYLSGNLNYIFLMTRYHPEVWPQLSRRLSSR